MAPVARLRRAAADCRLRRTLQQSDRQKTVWPLALVAFVIGQWIAPRREGERVEEREERRPGIASGESAARGR